MSHRTRIAFVSCLGWAISSNACDDFEYQHLSKSGGAGGELSGGSPGLGGTAAGGHLSARGGAASGGALAGGASAQGGTLDAGGTLGQAGSAGQAEAGQGGIVGVLQGGSSGGAPAGGKANAAGGTTTSGGATAQGGSVPCTMSAAGTPSEAAGAGALAAAGAGAGGEGPANLDAIALTPPMGWNSWNRFGGSVSEGLVKQIADAMVSNGMRDAGYEYVNIDDTWQSSRDACGHIVPDKTRFPNGIKALADYVHARGLKLGLYSDRGTATCGGRPGSYGFEVEDATTYAAWGVDYLKYDNCAPAPGREGDQETREDYTAMGNALRATGRPIVFSICAWWFQSWMPSVGHLWRTTTDITDNWSRDYHGVVSLLNKNGEDAGRFGYFDSTIPDSAAYAPPGLAQYAGPGHWNDPDMLEVGNGGMTDVEYRSHFSMWAMMAAPLIAGNDLRSMTQATKDILINTDIIAVDQDALGKQGRPISVSKTLEVWAKPLVGAQTYAVALLNRTSAAADITVTWSSLGLTSTSATVRDLWAHADLGSVSDSYTATSVPSHGVVVLKVAAE